MAISFEEEEKKERLRKLLSEALAKEGLQVKGDLRIRNGVEKTMDTTPSGTHPQIMGSRFTIELDVELSD